MSKQLITEESLAIIKQSLIGDTFWGSYFEDYSLFGERKFGMHLAIMSEPFYSYVLDGSKTMESRFSKNQIAPYYSVQPGDAILFKKAGATDFCIGLIWEITFYQLTPELIIKFRDTYAKDLMAFDDEFWRQRISSKYGTLMKISNVSPVDPIEINKKDRRGWVKLIDKGEVLL